MEITVDFKVNISKFILYIIIMSIIGKGHYAWVYSPPLKCANRPDLDIKYKNAAMKVKDLFKIEDLNKDDEVSISETIHKIDPQENYFIALGEHCRIAPTAVKNSGNDNLISVLEIDEDLIIGYFMTMGGTPLGQIDINNINLKTAIRWLNHLISALYILQKAQIHHLDIHDENILIGKDNLPRIIDFGAAKFVTSQTEINDKSKNYPARRDINDVLYLFNKIIFKPNKSKFKKENVELTKAFEVILEKDLQSDTNLQYTLTAEQLLPSTEKLKELSELI